MVIASRCEQERGRLIHGLLAMFLMGLVLQIKYSAVFEGMFFGLWLMWMDWRSGVALRPTLMRGTTRSEEHTSELQSLMRSSYAVFCLQKKITHKTHPHLMQQNNKK